MTLRGIQASCAAALLLVPGLPLSAAAPQSTPHRAVTPEQKARLAAMSKAADDLDEAADPAKYRSAWEDVIAYARSIYPPDHPEVAWAEGELVTADYLQGDIKGALARADRIAARLEAAGPEYRDRRMELANGQVVILMTLGQHGRARELSARVLEWRVAQSGGKPSSNVAAAYSNYANAEFEFGNYDRAIALVRQAIAEDRRLDPIPPNASPHFANLPIYLLASGRLEEAIEAARSAQAVLEKILPEKHPFLATNLSALARILLQLGRSAEAEVVARKAVDIAVARFGQSQQTASYLTALAQALTGQGKHEEAIAVAGSAAEILTKALGPDADRALNAREAHALALAGAGQGEAAMKMAEEISKARAAKLPPFHRDRIVGGDRIASLALKLGALDQAERAQVAAQALRSGTFPEDDVAGMVGEARLAAIEARRGNRTGGLKRAQAVADRLDARLVQASLAGSRRSGLDLEIRNGYGWALDAAVSAGDADAAFSLAQRMLESPAGRAVEAAARRAGVADPQIVALLRERQDAAVELEGLLDRQLRLAGRGESAETIGEVEAARRAAAARLAQGTAALRARAPDLVANEAPRLLSLAAVRAALGPDEALLVAALGTARTTLFAVTRDKVTMASSDVGAEQVGEWVTKLRASVAANEGGGFDFATSADLHALLLPATVRATIAGRPRLLVAANGSLAALPFAVLAPAQRGAPRLRSARWLVRDHALVTLPSIASVAAVRSARDARRIDRFVALGAPALSGGAGSAGAFRSANLARQVRELPQLPATEPELRALGAGLAARDQIVLTGDGATEAALRGLDLTRADVLAFATHGLTAGELEGLDEPALVLTPSGGDDGLLTSGEIMRLKLNAAWVILSACNTAAGGGVDDSGLAGLARAFLYAGGRNLLASHWAVQDDASAFLTVETVRRFGRGADPAQALREAMLRMIDRSPIADSTLPIRWAPFVYVGR